MIARKVRRNQSWPPSPHPDPQTHGLPAAEQVQHGSILQELEHPSPLRVFPSSHSSPASTLPLPHMTTEVHGWLPPQPQNDQHASTLHELEQPSPLKALPSSHSS